MRLDSVESLNRLRNESRQRLDARKKKIFVCLGPGCLAAGSDQILEEFNKLLAQENIKDYSLEAIKKTGCHGLCARGPIVVIEPEGIFYSKVKKNHVSQIIEKTLKNGELIESLLYSENGSKKKITDYRDIPFYANQYRIGLRNVGKIDPDEITDYIASGGYQALARVPVSYTHLRAHET